MLMTLANDANDYTVVGGADSPIFFVADDSTWILRWWSTNKFCKLQVRKLPDIKKSAKFAGLPQVWQFSDLLFRTICLKFADFAAREWA